MNPVPIAETPAVNLLIAVGLGIADTDRLYATTLSKKAFLTPCLNPTPLSFGAPCTSAPGTPPPKLPPNPSGLILPLVTEAIAVATVVNEEMIPVAQETNLVPIYPIMRYLPIPPSRVAIPDATLTASVRKSRIFLRPPSTEPPIATRVCFIALVTTFTKFSTALKKAFALEDDRADMIPLPNSVRRGLRCSIIPTIASLRLSTALLNAPWSNVLIPVIMSPRAFRAVLSTMAKLLIRLVLVATVSTKVITDLASVLIPSNTPFTSWGLIDLTMLLRVLESSS